MFALARRVRHNGLGMDEGYRYLAVRREVIDQYLSSYLERRARAAELPETLYSAILYALEGGKRLRPIILLAAAEAVGGEASLEGVLPAAAAVEVFHSHRARGANVTKH